MSKTRRLSEATASQERDLSRFLSTIFSAALCLASPLAAQEAISSASLAGRVCDASGAVLPGVLVQARAIATSVIEKTTTDGAGRFRFPFLQVGEYQVTVVSPGFSIPHRRVSLTIGAAFDLTITMTPGSTTSLTVVAPVVETNRTQVSETVLQPEISDLPYEGRNYLDLALLLPGVSPTNTASTQTLAETSEVVGQGYSVNSQRNFSNSFVVDGLSNNDDAAGVAGNVFGLDVVREFQVVTSGGQAEFGRALGGYFNILTRSGSNQWHGTMYGFLRNQRLNSNNALSASRLPLTQGQYGVSLSGPVRRDRTFIFGNFEENRLNTANVITVSSATAAQINARLGSVGYQAPLLPLGTGATTLFPTTLHTDTVFLRGDHRFTNHSQFNMRYSLYQLSSKNARGAGSLNEVSNGTSVFDTNHTIAFSHIATLSPHLFNEAKGQFAHDDLNAPPNDLYGPAVTISGVAIFGRSTSSPTARLNHLYEVVDNVVTQQGATTIKTGVDFLYNNSVITYPQSLRGAYSFSSLANFLVGTYNSQGFTQTFGTPTVTQNNPSLGLYVQDEWRVSHSLTVNAGVRYDLEWLQTINTDVNNVSPRVGLAWSPFKQNTTVVRASYGIFYDRVPLRPLANALLSANNTTDPAQARFLSYSFSPTDAGAPIFPAVASSPPLGTKPNYALMDRHIQNPYSQQASLVLEQQFGAVSSITLGYQHLRGLHLISSINTNINTDGTRPDVTRGNVKPYSSIFDSYYDGLSLSLLHRPVSWGSVRLSYTWSKAIDDVGEFFFSSPVNNFAPQVDRSRSDDDQRHRTVFNVTLHSPATPNQELSRRIIHGWNLSGILQYYSRLPFNVVTGTNTKQATTQRPCVANFSLAAGAVVNPCTEALPGALLGRNAGIGFDFFTLNTRLSRTFSLTEKVQLEAMVEAFNALNHRNDMIPNTTFGTGTYPYSPAPTFGRATAVGDPRNIQFAARLRF